MDIGEEELIRSEQVKIVYVSSLPYLMQQQIRKEVIEKLQKLGSYSPENVERAINSRLSDLENVIDVRKYEERQQEEKKRKDNEKENKGKHR